MGVFDPFDSAQGKQIGVLDNIVLICYTAVESERSDCTSKLKTTTDLSSYLEYDFKSVVVRVHRSISHCSYGPGRQAGRPTTSSRAEPASPASHNRWPLRTKPRKEWLDRCVKVCYNGVESERRELTLTTKTEERKNPKLHTV